MKRGKNHKLNDNVKCPFSDCLFGHHPSPTYFVLLYFFSSNLQREQNSAA